MKNNNRPGVFSKFWSQKAILGAKTRFEGGRDVHFERGVQWAYYGFCHPHVCVPQTRDARFTIGSGYPSNGPSSPRM